MAGAKITRDEMEHLRGMLDEMETLAVEVMAPTPKLQTIFYKDYRTGKGIPKTDVGLDGGREDEKRLMDLYLSLKAKRAKEILRLERFLERVDDEETRTILRMYYRDGLSLKTIAIKMGYSKSAISYKINAFWTLNN